MKHLNYMDILLCDWRIRIVTNLETSDVGFLDEPPRGVTDFSCSSASNPLVHSLIDQLSHSR